MAQLKTDPWLEELLRSHASPLLQQVLDQPDTFRYQIIYTRIDRDKDNKPHFTPFYFRVNRNNYFNPASMVKLPVAVIALEKLGELNIKGLDRETAMFTDSAFDNQTTVKSDTSAANGLPSIGQYIRKIFLVSDNDAYNRLYEFVGQQRLNQELWQKGYKDVRITRRFVPMNEEQNRHTNPIRFEKDDQLIYQQPAGFSNISFDFSRRILIGRGHYDREEKLVMEPMDFTTHNNFPLEDLQLVLRSVLFPESVSPNQRFHLKEDDCRFLLRYMSELPSESRHPAYDSSEFFDSYAKFFMFKSGRTPIPPYIRVFNKTGWSYGFLTDVAYIVDFRNNVEFMLSGVIYVNSDGILNDDKYEYEQVGYPFFKEIGNIIYDYEVKRNRLYPPDLSAFRFDYPD